MRSCCTSSLMISIHALREEGDFRFVWEIWMVIKFLSTPSARRATTYKHLRKAATIISIHALREEGDDVATAALRMAGKFLSTPSARRATPLLKSSNFQPDDFYPRPPRGGRRGRIARESSSTVFLSTPSARRATRTRKTSIPRAEHFYPRPPRGGRREQE